MDFDKLYNAYYMRVYSYAMTIVKSAHLAEEVAQQTFYKALKSLPKFSGKSDEFTWLCAIAKNCALDELNRRSKLGEPVETLEDMQSEHCLEQTVEDDMMTLKIHRLLHEMDEPYKEVFQLRVFGELPFSKIGIIFGKTENWARVTYHRARLKLIERMDDNGSK